MKRPLNLYDSTLTPVPAMAITKILSVLYRYYMICIHVLICEKYNILHLLDIPTFFAAGSKRFPPKRTFKHKIKKQSVHACDGVRSSVLTLLNAKKSRHTGLKMAILEVISASHIQYNAAATITQQIINLTVAICSRSKRVHTRC